MDEPPVLELHSDTNLSGHVYQTHVIQHTKEEMNLGCLRHMGAHTASATFKLESQATKNSLRKEYCYCLSLRCGLKMNGQMSTQQGVQMIAPKHQGTNMANPLTSLCKHVVKEGEMTS